MSALVNQVKAKILAGEDVTSVNSLGRNILHDAVTRCDLEMVKMLRANLKPEVWNALLQQKSGPMDKRATPVGLAPKFSEFPELVALLRPAPMHTVSFSHVGEQASFPPIAPLLPASPNVSPSNSSSSSPIKLSPMLGMVEAF